MTLLKVEIPPGVYRNATPYQGSARWYDVNLVRWIDGLMMPVGGWQRFSASAITGICRGLHAWRDSDNLRWLAVGTNEKLYVHDEGAAFDITPAGFVTGGDTSLLGLGYGAGPYGEETYGDARTGSTSLVLDAATWTFDSWGEYLVGCCTSDGKIYEWQLVTATPAAAVSNAPTSNRGCFVTDERHLVALGAGGDPRAIAWSDAEDNTLWTPASTNQAGDWLLNTPGHIHCAVKTRGETVILTSADAHIMRFIGSPLVYSFERVGKNCGAAGPNAAIGIEGGVAWMGNDGRFYVYDGAVRDIPCDIQDWVESEFNKLKATEVYAGTLTEHGELWWFFPTMDGTMKYAMFNYRQNFWSMGSLDRTAWLDRGVWKYPVAASSAGVLYQHEDGNTDSGVTRVGTVYAESGGMEIGNGDQVYDVVQLMPDENTRGDLSITLKTRYTPNGDETTYGPYLVRSDGYTDARASGRQMKIRLDATRDADWRWGLPRADVRPSGAR